MEHRLDSHFYSPIFRQLENRLRNIKHLKLSQIINFSDETWDLKKYHKDVFPYIEIGEIDTVDGEIKNISILHIDEAPSRAKMIVRTDDIILSTTRSHRGAISWINEKYNLNIASTGFAVLRNLKINSVSREYLYHTIRENYILTQLMQRSSGGNYPAITLDELGKVLIPLISNKQQEKFILLLSKAYANRKIILTRSQELLNSIDDYLLSELSITPPEDKRSELKERVYLKTYKYLSEGRFDAPYNQYNWNLNTNKFNLIRLKEYVLINPKTNFKNLKNDSLVTFIPMELVSGDGEVDCSEQDYIFNSKGYTCFKENDLLWAKITPCMENGKSTVARNLFNRYGFGSTEFHVFRIINLELDINYLFELFHLKYFRKIAKLQFGGSAGHQRVPLYFFKSLYIPLPPLQKQKEIAKHISEIRAEAKRIREQANKELDKAKKEVERMILSK